MAEKNSLDLAANLWTLAIDKRGDIEKKIKKKNPARVFLFYPEWRRRISAFGG